jgi:hypothetical protein
LQSVQILMSLSYQKDDTSPDQQPLPIHASFVICKQLLRDACSGDHAGAL